MTWVSGLIFICSFITSPHSALDETRGRHWVFLREAADVCGDVIVIHHFYR